MSTEPPARHLALVFCMFFSVYTVFASISFSVYALSCPPVVVASLLTAVVTFVQGISAFLWLRGPLAVGAAQGWREVLGMWCRGRLAKRSVRVWMTSTVLLPVSFINQAISLAAADVPVVTIGALVLSSEVAVYLGVVAGLFVSGMQNRTIPLQDI
jgi:hypothetical protein